MLTFTVPSGIGDISWLYSKVCELAKTRQITFRVCDGEPRRSSPFIDILPNIINGGYIQTDYFSNSLPIDTDLSSLPDGEYKIQANHSVDAGIRLEKVFPHQPTAFHYDLNITDEMKATADAYINSISGLPRIGIYASSHNGIGWQTDKWVSFVLMLREKYPLAAFYIIGAKWDNRTMDVHSRLKELNVNCVSQVGEHHIGATLHAMKQLDYFFAYPSGLGIMADVIDTPCTMWLYSEFPQGLIDVYADPINIQNKRHINVPTQTVEEAFNYFVNNGAQHIKNVS